MLKISKTQMSGFERASAQDFEGRMLDYLKSALPEIYSSLGEAEAIDLIRYGAARTEHHDILSELHICLYICLMIDLGRDFDVDPAIPWAGEMLTDKMIHEPSERLEKLYDYVAERRHEAGEIGAGEAEGG